MARKTAIEPLSVAFVSLGCAKNLVDSERMLAMLGEAGYTVGAEQDQAEVIVINTCGFLADACRESYEVIREALSRKQTGPCRRVVVTGCLPSRLGRRLLDDLPGIDALVGVNNRRDLLRAVAAETESSPKVLLSTKNKTPSRDTPRVRITPGSYAYLRISEGCSQHCSFCTIPAIRGPFRSKSPRTILSEAKELLADGSVELNIIGQDTSSYGRDLPADTGLAALLAKLDKLPGLGWLRILYAYPSSLTNDTIKAMADLPHFVHYLDLPLQHISDPILRRMGRRFSRARSEKLIDRLFKAMPDLALRTTIIVGFPGETEAQFDELLDFVRRLRFHALGAFTFSPEPGTPAADFPHQAPEHVKQQRLQALMQLQQEIVAQRNTALLGEKIDVLIDRQISPRRFEGRYYAQAPEVDGICRVRSRRPLAVGQIVRTKITGYDGYDLLVVAPDYTASD
ncbi:MAG: 30S ribosomal protein S12 methylthiotransferase RimO [Phycisphaerae bacterium]|nr:30S ribosomal protein S12 methylthiotransferase RimO [Phycisphaerae bacterium]